MPVGGPSAPTLAVGERGLTKVFGIGAHRTGTSSLMRALRRWGYRTSHWKQRDEIMADLARGHHRLSVMDRYDAVSDFPVPCMFRELATAFPEARFVLTVRDPAGWLESVRRHTAGRILEPEERLFYGRPTFDAAAFARLFSEHNAAVRSFFEGRSDLLVMDICGGDGWKELVRFLGLPEPPDLEFPWLNRS